MSDRGRVGYLKVLPGQFEADPWIEQWANEQIVSTLACELGIPAVEARAGEVEGELGAIVVFMDGRKLSELHLLGFQEKPIVEGAENRDQLGLMIAFDVWILNVDRGPHNIFMAVGDGRPNIALIDHGHVLLLPRDQKGGQPAADDWLTHVVSDHVNREEQNQSIRQGHLSGYASLQEIAAGARTIADVSDATIDSAVSGIDERFFCCHPDAMATLLKHRRDRLGESLGMGHE